MEPSNMHKTPEEPAKLERMREVLRLASEVIALGLLSSPCPNPCGKPEYPMCLAHAALYEISKILGED